MCQDFSLLNGIHPILAVKNDLAIIAVGGGPCPPLPALHFARTRQGSRNDLEPSWMVLHFGYASYVSDLVKTRDLHGYACEVVLRSANVKLSVLLQVVKPFSKDRSEAGITPIRIKLSHLPPPILALPDCIC